MLFKLANDGKNTIMELDGKPLSKHVTRVSFTHDARAGEEKCVELSLTFDLRGIHEDEQNGDRCGLFEDEGRFDYCVELFERNQKELCVEFDKTKRKREEAMKKLLYEKEDAMKKFLGEKQAQ